MSKREIGLGVLALAGVALFVWYKQRTAAGASTAGNQPATSDNSGGSDTANDSTTGDLNDGAGSFG